MDYIINNINILNLKPERYWSCPNSQNPRQLFTKLIYSGLYAGSEKKDGYWQRFIKDENGNMCWHGRTVSTVTKTYTNKYGHCPHLHPFFQSLPNGTVLLGEAYFPDRIGSSEVTKILGCKEATAIKRQEEEEENRLHYYIFDILFWNGKSCLDMTYADRIELMKNELPRYLTDFVELAEFYFGEEIEDNLNRILSEGGEGLVITKLDSHPDPGKRTARKTMKVKKELQDTVDVVIMGVVKPTRVYGGKEPETWEYWMNERTSEMRNERMWHKVKLQEAKEDNVYWVPVTKRYFYGWASGFVIGAYKNGELVKIGQVSGIDDNVAEHWRDYIGTVLEISAMQVSNNQNGGVGLRHPRIVSYRTDKNKEDCKWEDIFG